MLAGIIGVPFGSYLVQRLRPQHTVKCDALVCATGLLVSAPFVYGSLLAASRSIHWCFVCMFVAELSLNMCWSIVADMLLVRAVYGMDGDAENAVRCLWPPRKRSALDNKTKKQPSDGCTTIELDYCLR